MNDKIRGSLFGIAFGDAIGADTEFSSVEKIYRQHGPRGPHQLPRLAMITDDTQMSLAVADALVSATAAGPLTAETLEPRLRGRFIQWWDSPDNDRAPGAACMKACGAMARGSSWLKATGRDSKGCGANMRVVPVGLVPGLTDEQRAGAAQLQSAMTHGHPTALAAADLTAFAVRWLADGMLVGDLVDALCERCLSQRNVYHQDWLGALWYRPGKKRPADPEKFIEKGWDECFDALANLDWEAFKAGRDADPCKVTGGGWVAEQALAAAVYCLISFPDEPVDALARAAASSGDSDSIGAILGGMVGAAYGAGAWPADWFDRIEHRVELEKLSVRLDN